MGWNTANEYFDSIATALIKGEADDELRYQVCKTMIGVFREGDWDTEDESLETFAGDAAIRRAFREFDITLTCGHEHPEDPAAECVLERDHPGVPHQDEAGRTWPAEVPAAEILALRMQANDAGAETFRDYLIAMCEAAWGEKRLFGTSGWRYELYLPLVKAGFLKGSVDEDDLLDEVDSYAGEQMIFRAMNALAIPNDDSELLDDARALALHCRSIFAQMPAGMDEILGIDWESLPDWFTGDTQGVELWGGVVDGWR